MQRINKNKFPDKIAFFFILIFFINPDWMKKYFVLISLIFLCCQTEGATTTCTSFSFIESSNQVNPIQLISSLSIKKIQQLIGRKLSLKEKISVKIIQCKMRKGFSGQKAEDYKDKGKTAMIFGIIALASFLLIPIVFFGSISALVFSIAALVMGKKSIKNKFQWQKSKNWNNPGLDNNWVINYPDSPYCCIFSYMVLGLGLINDVFSVILFLKRI